MAKSIERNYKVTMDKSDFDSKANSLIGSFKKIDSESKKLGNMDTSGIEKGMSRVQDSISSLKFNTINEGFQGMAEAAGGSSSLINGFITGIGIKLADLASSAISTGAKIADAFTFKAARDGFEEYELNMQSIQTILANTTGETTESVDQTLDVLNRYADETVYKFADMTYAIGRFTAAGNGLEDSAIAVKGLANYAASVGADAGVMKNAYTQISQALSAGRFTAQDWMSIQNSNLESRVLKEALVNRAIELGTLQEYQRDSVMTNFKGSMSDKGNKKKGIAGTAGWLTGDVFTSVMRDFSENETMLDAAKKIRTFSKLIDSMGERVGSSWGATWRMVLGNFDQASDLFTGLDNSIGTIIDNINNHRNELLQKWLIDMDGRNDVIQGVSNVWKELIPIFTAIGEAWNSVFPPTKAEDLKKISSAFLEWSKNIKMSQKDLEGLGNYVTNFAKVLKMVLATGKGVGKAFLDMFPGKALLDAIVKVSGAIFKALSKIIDGFNKARDAGQKTETSFNVFKKIGEILSNIIEKIADSIVKFVDKYDWMFERIGQVSYKFFELVKKGWEEFFKLFDKSMKWLKPIGNELAKWLKPIIKAVDEFLSTNVTSTNIDSAFDVIGNAIQNIGSKLGGLTSGYWQLVLDGVDLISKFFAKVKTAGDNVHSATNTAANLQTFGDVMKSGLISVEDSLNSTTIGRAFNLALAALISAWAWKMYKSAQKVQVVIEEVQSISKAIKAPFTSLSTQITKVGEAIAFNLRGSAFLKMSGAVAILGATLFLIAQLPVYQALSSMMILGLTMTIFGKLVKVIGDSMKDVETAPILKMSVFVFVFAGAIKKMAGTIERLGAIDTAQLTKGLGAVTLIVLGIMGTLRVASKLKTKSFGSLVGLSVAINLLIIPVKILGNMDTGILVKGLTSTVLLGSFFAGYMGLLAFITGKYKSSMKVGGALTLLSLATSINLLLHPVRTLGSLPLSQLVKGLAATAILNLIVAASMKMFGTLAGKVSVLKTRTILAFMALALNAMVPPIISLSNLSFGQALQSTVTLGAVIAELTSALVIASKMGNAKKGATALIMMSAIIPIIGYGLSTLTQYSWDSLMTAVASLALVLTSLSVSAAIIGNMPNSKGGILGLMGLAYALMVIARPLQILSSIPAGDLIRAGGALGLLAVGLLAIAAITGIPIVAAGISALSVAVSLFISSVGAGTFLFGAGMNLFTVALENFIKYFPQLGDAVGEGAQAIANNSPKILDAVERILDDLILHIPSLSVKLAKVLGEMVGSAFTALPAFLVGVWNALGSSIDQGIDQFGVKLTVGLRRIIKDVITFLFSMPQQFLGAVKAAILDPLYEVVKSIPGIGDAVKSAIDGIDSVVQSAKDNASKLASSILGGFDEAFSTNKPSEVVKRDLLTLREAIENEPMTALGAKKAKELAQGYAGEAGATKEVLEGIANLFTDSLKAGDTYGIATEKMYDFLRGLVEAGTLTQDQATAIMTQFKFGIESTDLLNIGRPKGDELGDGVTQGAIASLASGEGTVQEQMIKTFTGGGALESVKSQLSENMSGLAESGIQGYVEKFSEADLSQTGEALNSNIESQVQPVGETLQQAGSDHAQSYAEGFNNNIPDVTNNVNSMLTEMHDKIESEDFKPDGETKGTQFNEGLESQRSNIESTAESIASGAKSNLNQSAYDEGYYMGQGMYNGLDAWQGAIYDKAYAMAEGAKAAVRAAGAIASPSKAMKKLGSFLGEGLYLGLESWTGNVSNSGTNMVQSIMNGINRVNDELTGGLLEQMVYSPTVKPILDLSNVSGWTPSSYETSLNLNPNNSSRFVPYSAETPNNTINITVNGNANQATIKEIAQEVDKVLKRQAEQSQMSRGVYRSW